MKKRVSTWLKLSNLEKIKTYQDVVDVLLYNKLNKECSPSDFLDKLTDNEILIENTNICSITELSIDNFYSGEFHSIPELLLDLIIYYYQVDVPYSNQEFTRLGKLIESNQLDFRARFVKFILDLKPNKCTMVAIVDNPQIKQKYRDLPNKLLSDWSGTDYLKYSYESNTPLMLKNGRWSTKQKATINIYMF